ncbi:STAS domain-containing protein [Modestobacter sp. SYSU DS0511]
MCSLQGSMQFSSTERVLRTVTDGVPVAVFVLDLRRVSSVDDVARRMLAEMLRRLQLDGAEVALLDPDRCLDLSEQEVVQLPGRWSSLARLEGYERV